MDNSTPKVPLQFRESYLHNEILDNYIKHPSNARHLKIPYFFSVYSSYELREAAINAYNSCHPCGINSAKECDEWESLILFLKESERLAYHNLFPKVLSGYIFSADGICALRAIRFALSLFECQYEYIEISDYKIVKIIIGRLIKGLNFDYCSHDTEIRELGRKVALGGLFAILPEIQLILQIMLNAIYSCSVARDELELPLISYSDDDFIQVERALKIILREREFDTGFLPTIEKMAQLHKEKIKELKRDNDSDYYVSPDPWRYNKNQAILNETVRLLKFAQKDNLLHGDERRKEAEEELAKYS